MLYLQTTADAYTYQLRNYKTQKSVYSIQSIQVGHQFTVQHKKWKENDMWDIPVLFMAHVIAVI